MRVIYRIAPTCKMGVKRVGELPAPAAMPASRSGGVAVRGRGVVKRGRALGSHFAASRRLLLDKAGGALLLACVGLLVLVTFWLQHLAAANRASADKAVSSHRRSGASVTRPLPRPTRSRLSSSRDRTRSPLVSPASPLPSPPPRKSIVKSTLAKQQFTRVAIENGDESETAFKESGTSSVGCDPRV